MLLNFVVSSPTDRPLTPAQHGVASMKTTSWQAARQHNIKADWNEKAQQARHAHSQTHSLA